MTEEVKAKRYEEKYKLKMLEMKEANKKTLCMVNLISTLVTVGLALGTIVILNKEPGSCEGSPLRLTLWLMLGMHATNIIEQVCSMTGLDTLCCGCCCIIAFFFYEVGVLVYMQSVFYTSDECRKQTPAQYWYLLFNITVYFFFLFITIFFHCKALCTSPTREEIQEDLKKDEEEEKKAQGNAMN